MTYELPPSLIELIDVIGFDAASKLATTRGGGEVFIPKKIKEDCLLVQIIGTDAANIMLDYYGYGSIKVAQGHFRGEKGRKFFGLHLLKKGYSVAEVARKTDVSERTVYGWKSDSLDEVSTPLLDIMEGKI